MIDFHPLACRIVLVGADIADRGAVAIAVQGAGHTTLIGGEAGGVRAGIYSGAVTLEGVRGGGTAVVRQWEQAWILAEDISSRCAADGTLTGHRLDQVVAQRGELAPAIPVTVGVLVPGDERIGQPDRRWGFPRGGFVVDPTATPDPISVEICRVVRDRHISQRDDALDADRVAVVNPAAMPVCAVPADGAVGQRDRPTAVPDPASPLIVGHGLREVPTERAGRNGSG